MKMNISHPYKDKISLSFGQFTQIVGQDQQLKYYIWQILLWYFGGKKYSEEDLVLFEQNEPNRRYNGFPVRIQCYSSVQYQ